MSFAPNTMAHSAREIELNRTQSIIQGHTGIIGEKTLVNKF